MVRDSREGIAGLSYLANTVFPTGYRHEGYLVAGLSGIDFNQDTGEFVAVRDNWIGGSAPGESSFPNFMTLTPQVVQGEAGYGFEITGFTALANGEGPLIDGAESVRYDPVTGGLLFVSETANSLYQWNQDGSRTGHRLPDTASGSRFNAGLEGLTLTPSNDIWVAAEGTKDGDPSGISRISQVDRTGKVIAQYAYRRDDLTNNGVSEILAISDTSFLVLERAWDRTSATAEPRGESHNSIRVYRIDIATGSDVGAMATIADPQAVQVLAKTLVFDSASLDDILNTYETKIDNVEGMTFGPRLPNGHATLVMVSDNNNSGSQGKTQFLVFKVDSPIPEVQFWDGEGPMADGSFGGDGTWTAAEAVENWTRQGAWVNDRWGGRTAVFGGKPGTVTIDTAEGAVSARELQFLTSGYRLDGDALTLADGGMTVRVGDPSSVLAGQTVATIAADLTGPGGLDKTGPGNLVLSGASDYAGGTRVEAGALTVDGSIAGDATVGDSALLVVNGSIGGAVTVGSRATLAGTGGVGSATIGANGRLAPGDGIANFDIAGDLVFASGSNFDVQVDSEGNHDRVHADRVTIENGVRLNVSPLDPADDGANWDISKRYAVLTGENGLDGRFSRVSEDFAYLTAFVNYDANNAYLSFGRTAKYQTPVEFTQSLVDRYFDLREEHPDFVDLNLRKVREIMEAAPDWRKRLAVADNTNYNIGGIAADAMGGLTSRWLYWIGGEHNIPFMNQGDDSPGKLHEFGKSLSQSTRPCNVPVEQGGVIPLFGCSGSSSYPSGHTAKGTGAVLLAAYIFPERFQPLVNRGQQYGESRIVAGQHYAIDVMASRAMTYKAAADLFAAQSGDPGSWLNVWASSSWHRARMLEHCNGVAIGECALAPENAWSVETREDYLRNKAYYDYTANYGFGTYGATDLPMVVPQNAEYLILTRYPYLDREQLREIIRTTAYPSGGVLDDYWSRINLFAAAEGYGAFDRDVTIRMDAARAQDQLVPGAGFNAADRWRNDISGPGTLTKEGSGVLTLGGANGFAGFALKQGGLSFTYDSELTGSSSVEGGLLSVVDATLRMKQNLTVGADGAVRLDGATLATGGAMDIAGTVTLAGDAAIEVADSELAVISGVVTGPGALEKRGTGTLRLAGDTDYLGGTVVHGGVLDVAGGISGMVRVLDGGTLSGTGTFGSADRRAAIEIGRGGTFRPGAGIGTSAVTGDVSFAAGSLFAVDVDAAGRSDLLDVTGAVSIDQGALVSVTPEDRAEDGFFYAASTKYKIISATDGVAGTFGAVQDSFAFLDAVLSYDAGNVYLTLKRAINADWPGEGTGEDDPIVATDIVISAPSDLGMDPILIQGGNIVSTASMALDRDMRLGVDGATFSPRSDTTLELSGDTSGPGTLVKRGAGTLLFSGNGGHMGGTQVLNGLLRVDGMLTTGTVTVGGDGSLGGNGTLGAVVLQSGGVLRPGASIGTLTAASYTFDEGSTFEVEVDAQGRSDRIAATGTITIGSGARVLVLPEDRAEDGSTYEVSTRYTIASAQGGVTGTFASVSDSFAYLDSALSYDADNVYLTLDRVQTGGGDMMRFSDVVSTANRKSVADAVEALGAGNPVYEAALYLPAEFPDAAFEQLAGEIHPAIAVALVDTEAQVRRIAIDRTRAALGATVSSGPAARTNGGSALWLNGLSSWNEYDGDGNGNPLSLDSRGFLLGFDHAAFGDGRIGIALGYDRKDVNGGALGAAEGTIDSYHVAAFGGVGIGPVDLRFGGGYSHNDLKTTRTVAFPRFSETLSADYDGATWQAYGEAGWRLGSRTFQAEPFVGLSYIGFDPEHFSETGGAAALGNVGDGYDRLFSTAGLRLAQNVALGQTAVTLSAGAAWQHGFGDAAASERLAFADGASAFDVSSASLGSDTARVDAGVTFAITQKVRLSARYDGGFGSALDNHAASARLSVEF